jgi:plasmid maintenance system antidote protein VapI
VSVEQIEAVLRGAAPITAEIAWGLEAALGDISARFWMALQSDYDLGVARLNRTPR